MCMRATAGAVSVQTNPDADALVSVTLDVCWLGLAGHARPTLANKCIGVAEVNLGVIDSRKRWSGPRRGHSLDLPGAMELPARRRSAA